MYTMAGGGSVGRRATRRSAGNIAATGMAATILAFTLAPGAGARRADAAVTHLRFSAGGSLARETKTSGPRIDAEMGSGRAGRRRASIMVPWSAARDAGRPHGAVVGETAGGKFQLVAGDLRTRVAGGLFTGVVRPDSDPVPSRLLEIGASRALGAASTGAGAGAGFRWRRGPVECLGWIASGTGMRGAFAMAFRRSLLLAVGGGERIRGAGRPAGSRALLALGLAPRGDRAGHRAAVEFVVERGHRPAAGGLLEWRRPAGFAGFSLHRVATGAAYRATDGSWRRSEGAPRRDVVVRAGTRGGGRFRLETRLVDRTTPVAPARKPRAARAAPTTPPRLHTQTVEAVVSGVLGGAAAALLLRRETSERVNVRRSMTARLRLAPRECPGIAAELRAARSIPAAETRVSRPTRGIALVMDLRRAAGASSLGAAVSLVPRLRGGAAIAVPAETTAARGTRSVPGAALVLAASAERRPPRGGGALRIGLGAILRSGKSPDLTLSVRGDLTRVSRSRVAPMSRRR